MKKNLLLIAFLSITPFLLHAQVGIGTENPHGSAALEIESSEKGLLIPRLTSEQKNAIQNPAESLLIYQIDGISGFYFFNGKSWDLLKNIAQRNADWEALDGETQILNKPDLSKVGLSGDFSDLNNIPEIIFVSDTSKMLLSYLTLSKVQPLFASKVDLTAFESEIAKAKAAESANAANILQNSENINTLNTAVVQNSSDILTNSADISKNKTDISNLNTAVGQNSVDILGNTSGIQSNATLIFSNAANINSLNTAVTKNSADILTHTTDISTNKTDIINLNTEVGQNSTDIENNQTSILIIKGDVNNLNSIVAQNSTDIVNLGSDISNNKLDISNLNTAVGQNSLDILANTSAIQTNTSLIFANAENINNLNSAVVQNSADILANASNISLKENSENKSSDVTLADETDTKFPTEKAVKTYVDAKAVDLETKASGILPIANGGTGSETQNFVDLTTFQTIEGTKIFNSNLLVKGITVGTGNSDDVSNVAIGYNPLINNTGSYNTAVGDASLQLNTLGDRNTAMGSQALQLNTLGSNNTAIGNSAMNTNISGNYNAAFGALSLEANIDGSQNTAMGVGALDKITIGKNNAALGFLAGRSTRNGDNTEMNNSVLIGVDSRPNASGETNQIVIGYEAVGNGNNTVQLGNNDITDVRTSGRLTTGAITLPNTDGTNGQVLTTNGEGFATWVTPSKVSNLDFVDLESNQRIPGEKMFNHRILIMPVDESEGPVTMGSKIYGDNIYLGQESFQHTETVGRNNTVMGALAFTNSSGSNNTVIGKDAMRAGEGQSGDDNTAIGFRTLTNSQSGARNTAIGGWSMGSATGTDNTAIGSYAASNLESGYQNTFLGGHTDLAFGNLSNATAIGYNAQVTASNTIQLGNPEVTDVKTSGRLTTGAITLPNTDGLNGQVLTTNGSGTAYWNTLSASASSNATVLSTVTIAWSELNNYDVSNVSIIFVQPNSSWTNIYGLQGGVLGQVIHIYSVNNQTSNCCTGLSLLNFNSSNNTGIQKFVASGGVSIDSNGNTTLVFDGTYWRVTEVGRY